MHFSGAFFNLRWYENPTNPYDVLTSATINIINNKVIYHHKMKGLTKKIVVIIVGTIGLVASIISIYTFLNPSGGIIKVASIEIQGLQDFYVSNSQTDLSFKITLVNNGNEYITIEKVYVEQLMPSGNSYLYPDVKVNLSQSQIPVGSSVNMSILLPAHEAVGNIEFKIFIYYNNDKNIESRLFFVSWF